LSIPYVVIVVPSWFIFLSKKWLNHNGTTATSSEGNRIAANLGAD